MPTTPPSTSSDGMQPARALPVTDLDTHTFWTSGAEGRLSIYRCQDCAYYIHPPVRFCPKCESRNVAPEAVSGRGTITSFTINHQQWLPGLKVPYVLALVSIVEQDDVRLATNIMNCAPESVTMDMPVKVFFEQVEDLWVPLFEPETVA
ncbi:Zn-ribbon domain-containing OB-fold protein [Sphingomonas immobilis]|uniref:OB-fold domain-containing protein n=1 Tax=Sphingomonas immobilis TaxID=3063997 RepID=A0ABT9A2I8_9SPHN|nr:OB-fold domain-containing protein [Sphingomonas sp. CA1-15]MDO7844049.1 OB-fold domain-containing protein [Sphingomonas sp. CA1-15]